MSEASRWQQEFDALPEWAKQLVRGLAGSGGYGTGGAEAPLVPSGRENDYRQFRVALKADAADAWWDGFFALKDLANALSAPWPPPPPPERVRRAFNIVELMADADPDDDDGGFDQPCAFGNRVSGHAVYCHNEAWPDSPRKCRRDRDDYKHEDCPGFVANPDFPPE